MKILGVIPARYASSRFPGKPLAKICGKAMIEYVYTGCAACAALDDLVVATDDARIESVVKAFGGKVVMTSPKHLNGTDRIAEVAAMLTYADVDWVINIQGDEPLINAAFLNEIIHTIHLHPTASIITMVRALQNVEDITNPNVVKCVFNKNHQALYFSRSIIPYPRNPDAASYYQHIGVYAFSRHALSAIKKLSPSGLELTESLEQLRWLEHGMPIYIGVTSFESHGVDHPDDIKKIEALLHP